MISVFFDFSKRIILVMLVFLTMQEAKSKTVNILDFGAVADGKTISTKAFSKAINTCSKNGGGTIIVPAGKYLSGTIILYSNINLHLEPGATIIGSPDLKDYYFNDEKVGLIYCENQYNVSITGFGIIDGNGDLFMDLDSFKSIHFEGSKYARQKDRFRVIEGVEEDGPVMPLPRPNQMIIFSNCKNITIRDVTITNSPYWTIHMADVNGGVISGVKIYNNLLVPNSDGIDITSCSNINVSDCDIRGGDDGFAITGYAHHFDLAGYNNIVHDSKNINVSNCNIVSRSSGIRIGGWDQNNMINYNFSNINITNSNRGIVLTVRDSGSIKDINFNNIIIETRLHTGDWWGNGEPIQVAVIRGTPDVPLGTIENVSFENIIAKSEAGIVVYSSNESEIINLQFRNVNLNILDSPLNDCAGGNFDLRPVSDQRFSLFKHDIPGFYAKGVRDLEIHNFRLKWDSQSQNFFTHAIHIEDFNNLRIYDFKGESAPANKLLPNIFIENGNNFYTNIPDTIVSLNNIK